MNIFEGSRRIAKLTAAGITVGFLIAAFQLFQLSPKVDVTFQIKGPQQPALRASTYECPDDALEVTKYVSTKKRTNANIKVCFLAFTAHDGRRLIPFRESKGGEGIWWGDHKYADDVTAYMNDVLNKFQMSDADETFVDESRLGLLIRDIGTGLLTAIATLVAFWAFTWAVGWIVRGFMGIPQGKDSKE